MSPILELVRLPHAADLPLPAYETAHSAGLDLRAALAEPLDLHPGERKLIPTGLKIAVPLGFEAQVRPRSGLAIKQGITMLNSPGTIDADYRGEVMVIAINHGHETVRFNHGDRIAQLVVAPVVQVVIREVDALDATNRGEGGFGSTGVK